MNVLVATSLMYRLCRHPRAAVLGLLTAFALWSGMAQISGQTVTNTRAKTLLAAQPLWFEPTQDGTAMVSRFEHRSFRVEQGGMVRIGATTGVTQTEVTVSLDGATRTSLVSGAKPAPGVSNYFFGKNPAAWRREVRHFQEATITGVYPGIDVTYYGNGTSLEYDYAVAPEANPKAIRLRMSGDTRLDTKSGDLLVTQGALELLRLQKPVAYQVRQDGSHVVVFSSYAKNDDGTFGFALGSYDHTRRLIIDPVITYSSYFGGSGFDEVNDIKTDAAGDIYLLLVTNSIDLPVIKQIAGACVTGCGPTNPSVSSVNTFNKDIYVAKLDPTGKTLLFSTYIGGSDDEEAGSFALGSDGALYIAGETGSTDFPVVNQYSSTTIPKDAYGDKSYSSTLTKLSADGSSILYSTLIGGGLAQMGQTCCASGQNSAQPGSVALAANGIAYLLGYANVPLGGGGFVDQKGGSFTAGLGSYIAEFDTTKSGAASLIFAEPYGNPGDSQGVPFVSIATDSKGDVWAVGNSNFYATITPTAGALQSVCDTGDPNNCDNVLLTEINATGNVIYSTYFGGTLNTGGGPGLDQPDSIFIDAADNIYIGGSTNSVDYPLKNAAYTSLTGSSVSGFLTKFSPGAKSVLYSSYTETNPPLVSALPSGVVGLAGVATAGAPVVNGTPAVSTTDAYYEIFDTTKSGSASLLAASFLGATTSAVQTLPTAVFAATADAQGNLLFGGYTESPALPLMNPYQSTCNAQCDAYGSHAPDGFVTRVQMVASAGSVTLVPTTQTFPSTALGSTSVAMTSTLTNTTSSAFLFTSSFTDSSDFAETDNCNGNLAAGASCTFDFTFNPHSGGALSSTFTVTGTATPVTTLTVALSGTANGGTPILTIAPSSYDFGYAAPGATTEIKTLVLTNTGNATASPITYALSETDKGVQTQSFQYQTTCTSLAAGASCNVLVMFTSHANSAIGTLTVSAGTGVTSAVATLTGTGLSSTAATLTPATVSFGSVVDGATSSTQAVTLTNNTQAALPITGFTITGSNTITATTTCGTSLPVASACKYNVTFAPTTAGAASATLTVTDNQGTQSAALTGTGVAAPRFSPSSLSFGNVTIGTTATLTATLTNPGPAAYPIQALFSAGIFGIGGGTCATNPTLVAGASCTLVVTFTPTKAGVAIDAIEYGATTTEPAVILNLTATGVAPAAPKPPTFSPSSLAFGDVTIGTTATMTATLTNPGPAAYPVQAFFSAGIFGIGGGTCTTNPTLAAGASCTLVVTFTPTKAGVVTEAIEYGATETEPPVMLNLTATGVPSDDFALTDLSGSTVSAAPGSAVHVLLGVTSTNTANPFTSLVTFTISGLPAGVTASFSSTTVMPGIAGATTSLTITLPASNARNKMPGSPTSPREQETAYGISAAALLCGMLGMRKRLNVRLLIGLCVLGLLGGIVGCGSGVSSSTSAPPSTANVTVTATSGAIAHSTVFQLTVQ